MVELQQLTAQAVHLEKPGLQEAAARFADLFSSLTGEHLERKVSEVYAEGAYLNDNLKEVRGLEAIQEYLRESGEAVHSCTVTVDDVALSGSSGYVRWTMEIVFKKLKKGQTCRSQGISHLLFNDQGKVIYHRDYWDSTSGLFEHIPIVGFLIGLVKKRI